jgi:putative hydrolase of the HAD superfamily
MTPSGELMTAEAAVTAVFPPPGIDVVVFDVVGTLVEPSPPVALAYQRAAARHGVEGDVAEIQARFRAAWRRQEEIDAAAVPAFATSRAREADRWRRIVDDVFAGQPASAAIFADLWDHFGRVDAWRPLERGRDLVQRAIDAGATVVLASNFDERLFRIAGRIEPLCWADEVFPSAEIGWRKPAPQFFRWIERRLDRPPERMLLVGDDPLLDIAAARRSGWRALAITDDAV